MSKRAVSVLAVVGLIVFAVGLIVWYSTPGDVVVGPIIIMVVGAVIAGVAWLAGRAQDAKSTSDLADRVRAEREQTEE